MCIWHEDRLLVDGEMVSAEGGATYEMTSPSTEEVLGAAADASVPVDPHGTVDQRAAAGEGRRVRGPRTRRGAKAVFGGKVSDHLPKGYFYEPTLLAGAEENPEVAQDELFGPVLVVLSHDGDDDAVRVANNSLYGLSGSVVMGAVGLDELLERKTLAGPVG